MPEKLFKFKVVYVEVSEADVWVEDASEENAKERIAESEIDWEHNVKNLDCTVREFTKIELLEVDGEPVKGEEA